MMFKIKMRYSDEKGNEKYVMEDDGYSEVFIVNLGTLTIERADVYEAFEDVGVNQDDVHVEDVKETKKWLEENRDEFDFNVDFIISHLRNM